MKVAPLAARFTKFAGVGVVGTAGHYVTLAVLFELAGAGAVAASSVGFLVGAAINYALNYRFTFNSRKPHRTTAPIFFAIAGIGFLLNAAVMALLADRLGLHYLAAQVIATGTTLAWNFLANNYWTFRDCTGDS